MTGCVDENLFAFLCFFAYKHKLNENPRRFEDIFVSNAIAIVPQQPKPPITIRTHSNISIQCSSDTKINLLHILCRHCFSPDLCTFSTILLSDEDTVRISFSRNACKWNPSTAEYHTFAASIELNILCPLCTSFAYVLQHLFRSMVFYGDTFTTLCCFNTYLRQIYPVSIQCERCVLATPTSSTILLIFSAAYSPTIVVFQVKVQICSDFFSFDSTIQCTSHMWIQIR